MVLVRHVVGAAAACAAVACSPSAPKAATFAPDGSAGTSASSPQPAGWDADFKLAEATDTNPDPNITEITLEARIQNLTLMTAGTEGGPPPSTAMWTYNGTVPGPIIRTKKGDRLIVHFTNSLPETTTIHWHGMRVPNAMDGSQMVQKGIAPGQTFDYDFIVPDAGTYWYHPHLDTSPQVGFGLYGVLVVEDATEPPLGDELFIVLSDVGLNADGSLQPGDIGGWFGSYFGREGAIELVNGKQHPTLRMRTGAPQRWRILDASRARFQRFVVPGVSLTRIGGGDGLSAAPYAVTRADLTPGEREEIVAVATDPPGTALTAMFQDADRFHLGTPPPDVPLFDVQITGDPRWSAGPTVPPELASIAPIDVSSATKRQITFDDVTPEDGGLSALGINGRSSTNMDQMTSVSVNVGDTEIWTVTNNTSQDHPFHMHGFPFQVLSLGGAPPPVLEWRDNVNVVAKQSMQFAVSFDNRPGMWMFHCHILDHGDMGMMAMLIVNP
jgi:FtsP/CotA-like multicopper oxidase with cupredoxin domain